ncbi:MAG: ABC transporter ATP-binding protein [Thermoguttaceae bacterium]|nr:ABC transporter ATP-binding protein [Thermoguttaceae bacterium]MDW8078882.1 ABC transporter ATP-binding protein [Thermoguttaceae bacterium]
MLVVEHLSKHYASPAGPLVVLSDVNLTVQPGQSVAIMGPSGSGKSTLLNLIGALDRPTGGRVQLDGQDYSLLPEGDLARLRNQRIGFLFQDHHLLPQCTVLENVLVPFLAFGRPTAHDLKRAEELLSAVGLAARMDHLPGELSGGERQRAALVRAMVTQPRMLLADEPTGNLDADTAEQIVQLMLELHRQSQNLLIVVTHSPGVASKMDVVFQLSKGILKRVGQESAAS